MRYRDQEFNLRQIISIGIDMLAKALWFALVLVTGSSLFGAVDSTMPDLVGNSGDGYSVKISSQLSPLEINRIHSWHIEITDVGGRPVSNAQITVSGGMPDHDHGLPTQPQITEEIRAGTYLLEGMRFHMPGKWQIVIGFRLGNQLHSASIEFQL